MTNQAQAVIDFIKASKEGGLLPCPFCKKSGRYDYNKDGKPYAARCSDNYCPTQSAYMTPDEWNTRAIDLDDLLDVVVKMATLLREDSCGECNGTGEIFDEASNLMGAHGWMTCWKCYDTPVATVLRLAQPYIDAVGE